MGWNAVSKESPTSITVRVVEMVFVDGFIFEYLMCN